MNQSDFPQFDKAIKSAALALDVPLSAERIALYFEDLSDFPIAAVVDAIGKARRAQVYAGFPKVAEIRKHIEGTDQDRAELAWRTFCEICATSGYPSLQVTDGAMAFAIEHLGGWVAAQAKCNGASPEMFRSYENQFKTSYKLGQARQAPPQYFLGVFEANNRMAYPPPPGLDCIRQEVLMVRADKFLALKVPFDLTTGQIEAEARNALTTGGESLRAYLPSPAPQKLNPGPIEAQQSASPDEVREIKQAIRQLASGHSLNGRPTTPTNEEIPQ